MIRDEDYTMDERMEEGYLSELTEQAGDEQEPMQSPEAMVAEAKQRLVVVIEGGNP